MSQPAIIIGGDGKLGSALRFVLSAQDAPVTWTTRRPRGKDDVRDDGVFLDLLAPRLPEINADYAVVFLVAALTKVCECEQSRDAWRVNADAPRVLACEARERGWLPVFVSSNAVEIAPHTVYAMTKASAEGTVLALGGKVFRPGPIHDYRQAARALLDVGLGRSEGRIVRWFG